jgi:drug/metabolite transporter (DMT)-like permease
MQARIDYQRAAPGVLQAMLKLQGYAANYLLLALAGTAGFNLLFFRAMQTTSADGGVLIMATNPLLTALLEGPHNRVIFG